MNEKTCTTQQLTRRRYLAAQQLLYAYRTEYAELLKTFGQRSPTLVKVPTSTELTASQTSVLAAQYQEFLKERLDVRGRSREEAVELERHGVPRVCEERVEFKGTPLTFAQAEAYLSQRIAQSLSAARLEPHLLTSSPPVTSAEPTDHPASEQKGLEKGYCMDCAQSTPEMDRLEEVASAAQFREMDREDFWIALLGKNGKFSIRQSSFVIGCTTPPTDPTFTPSPPTAHIHKSTPKDSSSNGLIGCLEQRFDGALHKAAREIDVDLAKEGCESTETVNFAHVWLKADGRVCIKCLDTKSLTIDGKQVTPGKSAFLEHLRLLELESVALMVVINRNATQRVARRSQQEINI